MAKATNALTQGLSGKVSGLVFRRNPDGSISAGNAPRTSGKAPTAAMQAQRDRFQQATFYGRAVQKDPATKAAYEGGVDTATTSAYTVAVADYLNAPSIRDVDFSAYRGRVGDRITIQATDDFAVTAVRVQIENPDGSLVEQGAAQAQPDGFTFVYTATAANATFIGDKITVTAEDRAGNETAQPTTL